MASSRHPSPPPVKPLEVQITVVSAKHLKNVNWRHGDLKPYAVLYLDPDRRVASKADDSGSTRPVWNERFTLPVPVPLDDALLTLEIFHSKTSETPKPLVGTAHSPLKDLICQIYSSSAGSGPVPIRTLELRRPSGRLQGKIRIKVSVQDRPAPTTVPDYHVPPPSGYYYSTAPPSSPNDYRSYASHPPPPPPSYSNHLPPTSQYPPYGSYSDPYSGYYPSAGYYSAPPAPAPARPFYDRASGYGGPSGPSAPVDYSLGSSSYEQKPRGGKMGIGRGLAIGAVTGTLGGLSLEEGLKYEEEKVTERMESNLAARDDYSNYGTDYRRGP